MSKLCVLCRKRPAAVPDRNVMGRPIRRVCRECHSGRLQGDLRTVLNEREKAREQARLYALAEKLRETDT